MEIKKIVYENEKYLVIDLSDSLVVAKESTIEEAREEAESYIHEEGLTEYNYARVAIFKVCEFIEMENKVTFKKIK